MTSPNNDLIKTETPSKDKALFVVGLDKRFGGATPDEKFQRQKARKRIYVDSNSGPFKCPGCDNVTFSNRRSLDLHMKRLHKAGIVECDECGRKVLDLKRHKEILHKRFKIFDCPHCSDKFCTQDDLERHLAKIEKNNIVSPDYAPVVKVKPLNEANPDNKSEDGPVINNDNSEMKAKEKAEASKVVKEMESKVLSCSECGMKTHSRMTYIQHVLNGCIMDMVGGAENTENSPRPVATPSKTGARRGRPP